MEPCALCAARLVLALMTWPSDPGITETISFAELAVDFQLATHVSLDPCGDITQSQSFHTQSRIFAAASRRMAKICKSSLVPAVQGESPFAERVPVLAALGLGRCAGLRCRPCLFVLLKHTLSFSRLPCSQKQKRARFLRNFVPISSWPAPKWNGKQQNVFD